MIYDELTNIDKYRGISSYFDLAADFIAAHNLDKLPFGRTQIAGNDVFVNVMEADTVDPDQVHFEIHKNYWDIQIDLEGTELLQIGMGRVKTTQEYDAETDFGSFDCISHTDCVLGVGRFVICMTEEPHKPTLRLGECSHVKKCVIKVKAESLKNNIRPVGHRGV